MIDIRAFRANPQEILERLKRKGALDAGLALLSADAEWRAIQTNVDELRARQKISGKPTPEQMEELKTLKEKLRVQEALLKESEARRDDLLARVPNPPDDSAPDGDSGTPGGNRARHRAGSP